MGSKIDGLLCIDNLKSYGQVNLTLYSDTTVVTCDLKCMLCIQYINDRPVTPGLSYLQSIWILFFYKISYFL